MRKWVVVPGSIYLNIIAFLFEKILNYITNVQLSLMTFLQTYAMEVKFNNQTKKEMLTFAKLCEICISQDTKANSPTLVYYLETLARPLNFNSFRKINLSLERFTLDFRNERYLFVTTQIDIKLM